MAAANRTLAATRAAAAAVECQPILVQRHSHRGNYCKIKLYGTAINFLIYLLTVEMRNNPRKSVAGTTTL